MNHRERILAAIRRQPVDRIPSDMWATPEVIDKLFKHFNVNSMVDLYDRLEIDGIFGIVPDYIGPKIEQKDESIRYDEWGRGWKKQVYNTGIYEEQVVYPLENIDTLEGLESYQFPSPDWYDYSVLPAKAAQFPGRAIECGYTALFYYHTMLRGLEGAMMDLALRPEFSMWLIQKLSDFFYEYHRRCYEAAKGLIDLTQVTDDFGSQIGLLISPKAFEQYFRAPMQRAIDLAKSYNILVFHHDDGDCRRLIPSLVEMGIDILNPIQWRCGNWDLDELKTSFGNRLAFHGGVDNQITLPRGTPDDVRREVRWLIQSLGRDHTGLIVAPCHNLQAVSPVENIIALYEEVVHSG